MIYHRSKVVAPALRCGEASGHLAGCLECRRRLLFSVVVVCLLLCVGCNRPVGTDAAETAPRLEKRPVYFYAFQHLVQKNGRKPRLLTPAEVVALGKDVIAGGSWSGVPVDTPRTKRLRDNIIAAKRLIARGASPIKFFVAIRPDHYTELAKTARVEGFKDRWLLWTRASQYKRDVARFDTAGWTVQAFPFVSPTFLQRVRSSRPNEQPCLYGRVESSTRRFLVNGALADLRSTDYRRWQVAWAARLAAYVHADGFTIGFKPGWEAAPMARPPAFPRAGDPGGPLSPTVYAPGEWETAITAYAQELSALGLPILVRDSTPGRGGPTAWFTDALRRAVTARYKPLKLPHEVTQHPR